MIDGVIDARPGSAVFLDIKDRVLVDSTIEFASNLVDIAFSNSLVKALQGAGGRGLLGLFALAFVVLALGFAFALAFVLALGFAFVLGFVSASGCLAST